MDARLLCVHSIPPSVPISPSLCLMSTPNDECHRMENTTHFTTFTGKYPWLPMTAKPSWVRRSRWCGTQSSSNVIGSVTTPSGFWILDLRERPQGVSSGVSVASQPQVSSTELSLSWKLVFPLASGRAYSRTQVALKGLNSSRDSHACDRCQCMFVYETNLQRFV